MEQCLEQMDALARELEMAMGAIAANAPAALEQSVRLQQGRVGELAAVLEAAQKNGVVPGTRFAENPVHPSAANLDSRIRKAARKLWSLNEEYAALIEHSGRSMRMLKALYEYAPVPPNRRVDSGVVDRYQTWSLEG